MLESQTVRLTDPQAEDFGFQFKVGDQVKSTLPKGLKGVIRDGWTDTQFKSGQGKVYLVRCSSGKYFSALEEHLEKIANSASENEETEEFAGTLGGD